MRGWFKIDRLTGLESALEIVFSYLYAEGLVVMTSKTLAKIAGYYMKSGVLASASS